MEVRERAEKRFDEEQAALFAEILDLERRGADVVMLFERRGKWMRRMRMKEDIVALNMELDTAEGMESMRRRLFAEAYVREERV